MQNLPIYQVLPELKTLLLSHNRVVLQASTGAGKTTALPLELLNAPWLADKKILILEPRRLAVRASAMRMASLLGESVGERVGYRIKMDSKESEKTKILIVTEGILTRKIQEDPSLEEIGLVIFDEFHERSLHADLALALCLEAQELLREDLRILVMSATLNSRALSKLLGDAPTVQSQGRSYPVERIYLDPTTPLPSSRELVGYIYRRLLQIVAEESGNILVFLASVREIKQLERRLKEADLKDIYIAPLYGDLTKQEQDRAIKAPPKGKRKIVLSTNIAQTSLTIEGIGVVVDSGLHNVAVFNPLTGMNKLERRFISQDTATQRAGRAGRLSAGKAYHLWHASKALSKHDTPEILLSDLTSMVLQLARWGSRDIASMAWLDRPPASAITYAQGVLDQLGAIDAQRGITPHGVELSRYALHPRLAQMMIKAKGLGMEYEASLLGAILSERDFLKEPCVDLTERVMLLDQLKRNKQVVGSVDIRHARYLLQVASKLAPKTSTRELNLSKLGVLVAFAYPDRIAQLRHLNGEVYLLRHGKGARLPLEDELFNAPFLVVTDLDAKERNARIYRAVRIGLDEIEEHFASEIETQTSVEWNSTLERVEVRSTQRLGAMVLKESPCRDVELEEVVEVLLEELSERGLEGLYWSDEALRLRERLDFLFYHEVPWVRERFALEGMDSFSDYLEHQMDQWLRPYLLGKRTLRECRGIDLYSVLLGLMSYEELRSLNRLAPDKIEVASGSKIAINYANAKQPILAVRLQEMFGTLKTPTVLEGQVPLMLHLLSPAYRPVQMTQDLTSFWKETYHEVKKELSGRYKKHYWPDNPLQAQATRKTKKFM